MAPWLGSLKCNPANATLIQLDDNRPLFRFLREESHAEALVAGCVWVSTLGICRAYEDMERGDPGEGSLGYSISKAAGDGSNLQLVRNAARAGIYIGPDAQNIELANISGTTILSDAWLLCLTEECDNGLMAAFGRFCVRIERPRSLFESICEALVRKHSTRVQGVAGPVVYRDRRYRDDEEAPGHIALVKPERYRQQSEVRMVWWRHDQRPITQQLIDVPASVGSIVRVL